MRLANTFPKFTRFIIVLFALTFLTLTFGVNDVMSAKRCVLVEDFTNTRCGPCYTWQPYFDATLENFEEGVDYVMIALHVHWPGNDDPWYVNNTNLTADYISYRNSDIWPNYPSLSVPAYGVASYYWPNTYNTNTFEASLSSRIEDEIEEGTPISVDISAVRDGDDVDVTTHISSESDIDDLILRVGFIEKYNDYGIGGGYPSGHRNALLEVLPDVEEGELFDITSDETVSITFTTDLDIGWDRNMTEDDIAVVVWIEDEYKYFYQAGMADITQLLNPGLTITDMTIEDDDADGRMEAGETGVISLILENEIDYQTADDVTIELELDDPNIDLVNNKITAGTLEGGDTFDAGQEPLTFVIPQNYNARPVTMTITIMGNDEVQLVHEQTMMFEWPGLLVIDGSEDVDAIDEVYGKFDGDELPYADRLDILNSDGIEDGLLDNYNGILIHTFNSDNVGWIEDEVDNLSEFLDNGGNLIICSPFFCTQESTADFMHDYLGAELEDMQGNYFEMRGVEESEGFSDAYFYFVGRGKLDDPDLSPTLTPVNGGEAIINWVDFTEYKGVSAVANVTGTYTTMLCAFSPEFLGQSGGGESREVFFARMLEWLDKTTDAPKDVQPVVYSFDIQAAYPNPFNSQSIVPFSLDAAGEVSIDLFDINGRQVSSLFSGELMAGNHTVAIDAGALGISNGTYIVKLVSGDRAISSKLQYVK
ncbi:T9SS type A sorting domain-containing protein [Calditrichota bacterium]